MSGNFQKAKLGTEDVTDDFIVKGVDDKDTETNPAPITYTEDGQDRCLDVRVCNNIQIGGPSGIPSWTTDLTYLDMGVDHGGIARGTTIVADSVWVETFSYSGSGVVAGWSQALGSADSKWWVRIQVDGVDILNGSTGLVTHDIKNLYDLGSTTQNQATSFANLSVDADNLKWSGPIEKGIYFATSFKVLVMRMTGDGDKAWEGGLIVLSKES